jgi:hypothetical protein
MLVRDVLVTGTGLWVIISQVFSAHPATDLLVAGLALTAPSLADHARALLSGPTESRPSPPSPGSGPSPSGRPAGD